MLPCILCCKLSGKDSFRGFMFDEIGLMMNKSIVFTGGKEKGSDAEVGFGMGINHLSRDCFLPDRLHIAHATIGLKCLCVQIVPGAMNGLFIRFHRENTVVYAPKQTVGEECRAAGFRPRSLLWIHHRACPIAVALLQFGHSFGQTAVFLNKERVVTLVFRHVLQHLGKPCKHPTVAPCPEVFAPAERLVFRINIFTIAEIKPCFLVKHNAVGIADAAVELVKILFLARHFRKSVRQLASSNKSMASSSYDYVSTNSWSSGLAEAAACGFLGRVSAACHDLKRRLTCSVSMSPNLLFQH